MWMGDEGRGNRLRQSKHHKGSQISIYKINKHYGCNIQHNKYNTAVHYMVE